MLSSKPCLLSYLKVECCSSRHTPCNTRPVNSFRVLCAPLALILSNFNGVPSRFASQVQRVANNKSMKRTQQPVVFANFCSKTQPENYPKDTRRIPTGTRRIPARTQRKPKDYRFSGTATGTSAPNLLYFRIFQTITGTNTAVGHSHARIGGRKCIVVAENAVSAAIYAPIMFPICL